LKIPKWQINAGVSLLLLSLLMYLIHYSIFQNAHEESFLFFNDLAFLPLEVFLVTLILHRLLSEREKQERLEKLNMVIGVFFSEVGTRLLAYFSDFDPKLERIRAELVVKKDWTSEEFNRVNKTLRAYDYDMDIDQVNLVHLKAFLVEKRDLLLRLSENHNLMEHETFTDLLKAVFHLTEELAVRKDVMELPRADMEHLSVDIKRVYALIVVEWLNYMRHLKNNYPHMFSLAMRTNPFDQKATPIIAD
jgi:hypothetical protein